MRLLLEALQQCRSDARLADAGFARDQHDLAVAGFGTRPTAQQQVDLFVAADQRRQDRSTQRLEAALNDARVQRLPSGHRHVDALNLDGAKIAVFKQITNQPARTGGDNDRIRLGQALQPGGEVWRFTDDGLLLRRAFADQIANNDQPGGNPDARLQCDVFAIEPAHRIDDVETRTDSPLGIVLMCRG